jgi:DNA-directed RNA polymerase specialized sigma24 family protein
MMQDRAYEALLAEFDKAIRGMARKFAGQNEDLYEDLWQIGRIALWKDVDLTKVRANRSSMIRKAIKCRMIDFLRAYKPGRYLSLDEFFEKGWQVSDDSLGDLYLHPTRQNIPEPDAGAPQVPDLEDDDHHP